MAIDEKVLIERLEKQQKKAFSVLVGWAYEDAIKIINQLAEEHIEKDCSKCSRRSWYQKGYADAKKENGWIPCSEIKPRYSKDVLVCTKTVGITIACIRETDYCDMWFDRYSNRIADVIAWMPLPAPYKGEQK